MSKYKIGDKVYINPKAVNPKAERELKYYKQIFQNRTAVIICVFYFTSITGYK